MKVDSRESTRRLGEDVVQYGGQTGHQGDGPGRSQGGGEGVEPVKGHMAEPQGPKAVLNPFTAEGCPPRCGGENGFSAVGQRGSNELVVASVQIHTDSAYDARGDTHHQESRPERLGHHRG